MTFIFLTFPRALEFQSNDWNWLPTNIGGKPNSVLKGKLILTKIPLPQLNYFLFYLELWGDKSKETKHKAVTEGCCCVLKVWEEQFGAHPQRPTRYLWPPTLIIPFYSALPSCGFITRALNIYNREEGGELASCWVEMWEEDFGGPHCESGIARRWALIEVFFFVAQCGIHVNFHFVSLKLFCLRGWRWVLFTFRQLGIVAISKWERENFFFTFHVWFM